LHSATTLFVNVSILYFNQLIFVARELFLNYIHNMKFTKQEAFEKLKGILTESGKTPLHMSERSINEQLDTLMPLIANDEMELDAFVEKVTSTFKTMNANAKNDQSAFVNDWKVKHPEEKPPQNTPPANETPEMKAMRERLEALEQRETQRQNTQTIEEKKKQILSKLKEKGIKNEEWCNGMIAEIAIDKDTDVDTKVNNLVAFYNKTKADTRGGYTPRGGVGGGEQQKGEWDDVRKERETQIGSQNKSE